MEEETKLGGGREREFVLLPSSPVDWAVIASFPPDRRAKPKTRAGRGHSNKLPYACDTLPLSDQSIGLRTELAVCRVRDHSLLPPS